MRLTSILLLTVLLVPMTASAQIGPMPLVEVNVGPSIAPLGGNVIACISNDSPFTFSYSFVGPIRVFDSLGTQVLDESLFLFTPVNIAPGDAVIYYFWDQTDSLGAQVPAGDYTMEVTANFTTTIHAFSIGGVDAAVTPIGVHRPGSVRRLLLDSPLDSGKIYIVASALSANFGIGLCGGQVFPLDQDFVLMLSLQAGNGVFFNSIGVLDSAPPGISINPAIALPNIPSISGFSFLTAFAVTDPTQPCFVVRVSAPTTMTIL